MLLNQNQEEYKYCCDNHLFATPIERWSCRFITRVAENDWQRGTRDDDVNIVVNKGRRCTKSQSWPKRYFDDRRSKLTATTIEQYKTYVEQEELLRANVATFGSLHVQHLVEEDALLPKQVNQRTVVVPKQKIRPASASKSEKLPNKSDRARRKCSHQQTGNKLTRLLQRRVRRDFVVWEAKIDRFPAANSVREWISDLGLSVESRCRKLKTIDLVSDDQYCDTTDLKYAKAGIPVLTSADNTSSGKEQVCYADIAKHAAYLRKRDSCCSEYFD